MANLKLISDQHYKPMFLKRKVSVEDYCTRNFIPLFSRERETTWEALRRACNDSALSAVEAQLYYKHLSAVFIQLMLIGVAKNCSMDASSDAHVFVMMYLKERNLSEIDEISKGYSQHLAPLAPTESGRWFYISQILSQGARCSQ